jgi:hypothetical protein
MLRFRSSSRALLFRAPISCPIIVDGVGVPGRLSVSRDDKARGGPN